MKANDVYFFRHHELYEFVDLGNKGERLSTVILACVKIVQSKDGCTVTFFCLR